MKPLHFKVPRLEDETIRVECWEWDNFFEGSGFKLIDSVVIKTESTENRKLKNDNNVKEVFVNYNLGAFGNRKVAFVLRSI